MSDSKIDAQVEYINKNLTNISSCTVLDKLPKDIDQISNFLQKEGSTEVKINIINKENKINFKLKNKRQIDRKSINILRNKDISTVIQ